MICDHCGQYSMFPGPCGCRKIFVNVIGYHQKGEWAEYRGIFSSILEDEDFIDIAEELARGAHKKLRRADDEECSYVVLIKRRDGEPFKFFVDAELPPGEVEFTARPE